MRTYNNNKIALRPFLDSILHSCNMMGQSDLIEFVLYYAEHLPTHKRVEFLDTIASFTNAAPLPVIEQTVFDKISNLKEEIMSRKESIEDGSIYDDFDQDDWNYYDDESPEILLEEHKHELAGLFYQADQLFLAGKLDEAHAMYAALYALFGREDSSEDQYSAISDYDIDIDHIETKARYCRSLYEISPSDKKAVNLAEAMHINASMSSHFFDIHENNNPMLADIEDAGRETLSDKNSFLPAWIELLSHYNSDRAQILLMEAVYAAEGFTGVQRLARQWKDRQPRGYLFCLQLLKAEKNWKMIIDTAREAFPIIEFGVMRGLIAIEMINAAEIIHDTDSLLIGKRELFYSVPEETNLIKFLKEAAQQQVMEKEIEHSLTFMGNYSGGKILPQYTIMVIKVLLMKGDLTGALALIGTRSSLGWTSINKPTAVLFAGLLAALAIDKIDEAEIIKHILKRHSDSESLFDYTSGRFHGSDLFFFQGILEGLKKFPITSGKKQITYAAWVENVGKERINSIVSNKHRQSYYKAAEILGGLAECFMLLDQQQKALSLIHEYRDVKYHKYYAFKREVASVLSKSRIL